MQILTLPIQTVINRVIPKNSFDKFTTSKQKKLFTELVDKILWSNKLSHETINLAGKDFAEIQIFEVLLKKKANIIELLNIIDRSIPYPIIFVVTYDNSVLLSASYKHSHPTNENSAVLDWTFSTDWLAKKNFSFKLSLQQNLDFVFIDFCKQLSGRPSEKLSITQLILKEQKTKELKTAITTLQTAIKNSRQFNKKVEMNIELQQKIKELEAL